MRGGASWADRPEAGGSSGRSLPWLLVTDDEASGDSGSPSPTDPARPAYKGAPLDPERGPGLGCFWLQTIVFLILFVLTPFGVINGWPTWLTTTMFIVTLILLLFVGQTVIFLLRLVAADRRSRRRPLREGAGPTVGDLSAAPGQETQEVEPAEAGEAGAGRQAATVADADAPPGEAQAGPGEGDGPPAVRQ